MSFGIECKNPSGVKVLDAVARVYHVKAKGTIFSTPYSTQSGMMQKIEFPASSLEEVAIKKILPVGLSGFIDTNGAWGGSYAKVSMYFPGTTQVSIEYAILTPEFPTSSSAWGIAAYDSDSNITFASGFESVMRLRSEYEEDLSAYTPWTREVSGTSYTLRDVVLGADDYVILTPYCIPIRLWGVDPYFTQAMLNAYGWGSAVCRIYVSCSSTATGLRFKLTKEKLVWNDNVGLPAPYEGNYYASEVPATSNLGGVVPNTTHIRLLVGKIP